MNKTVSENFVLDDEDGHECYKLILDIAPIAGSDGRWRVLSETVQKINEFTGEAVPYEGPIIDGCRRVEYKYMVLEAGERGGRKGFLPVDGPKDNLPYGAVVFT